MADTTALPAGMGCIQDRVDARDFRYADIRRIGTAQVPETLDLRECMPQTEDQLNFSACVGNSVAQALEALQKKSGRKREKDLSRMFVYWYARAADGLEKQDGGCMIRSAIKAVAARGVCPESRWGYSQSHLFREPGWIARLSAKKRLLTDYQRVDADLQGIENLKAALAEGFPVVFGCMLYPSFCCPDVNGVIPMPKPEETTVMGRHAMVLAGYGESGFIVQNSWGRKWGRDGYCYLPFEYFARVQGFGLDFWVLRNLTKI